jgi:hypothetical protein
LLWNIRNVEVNPRLGLGSDHLPITYELDLGSQKAEPTRFNPDTMNLDKFLAIVGNALNRPVPVIKFQKDLDGATEMVCDALVLGLNGSTAKRRPCAHSKQWWSPELRELMSMNEHR